MLPTVYAIALTTRFRDIQVREGVVWRGEAAWTEFSPFWDYDPAECVPWLRAAHLAGERPLPTPVRQIVPVNVTVPAVDPAQAHTIAATSGCRTAKVKVAQRGQSLTDDVLRLEAVRDALGPDAAIRIDANGAWDVETAVAAIAELERASGGLEYVEQPCPSVEELAAVRRRVDVRIAADESIRRADDPARVRRLDAADVMVIKVQPLGGIDAALRVIDDVGLPAVVSSAVETSIGLAHGVMLAAALPELPFACGLATGALLTKDVVPRPLRPRGGALSVAEAVAVLTGADSPTPDTLGACTASPATVDAWHHRMAAVAACTDDGGALAERGEPGAHDGEPATRSSQS